MESMTQSPIADALDRARHHSPFLARQIEVYPALVTLLQAGKADEAWETARGLAADEPVDKRLRVRRSAVALVAALSLALPAPALLTEADQCDPPLGHLAAHGCRVWRRQGADPTRRAAWRSNGARRRPQR